MYTLFSIHTYVLQYVSLLSYVQMHLVVVRSTLWSWQEAAEGINHDFDQLNPSECILLFPEPRFCNC